jgi:tryptophan-rich sensory protein
VLGLFAANALLNILWSALYFKLQRPDWALYEVGLLWLSILALIVGLWRISRWASLLLLPYAVWVAIAAALNLATVRLNGPFV